ncbi:hypothetical protein IT568_08040 [bacterium]|nr:hypothetical protein [bacterium]
MKIWLLVFLVTLLSCENPFSPEQGIVSDKTDNRFGAYTPETVLKDFETAYNTRDSLLYSELLDENFKFIYNDPENPGTFNWGRENDLRATGRLFRIFNNINLTFNELGVIYFDSLQALEFGNKGDSIATIVTSFSLKLDSQLLQGTADFTFRKKPTELWKVIQWIDYSN